MRNIGVVFGGRSCEHEISIISALQVMHALKENYTIIPIYISKEGEFYSSEEYMDLEIYKNPSLLKRKKDKVYIQRDGQEVYCVKNWFKKDPIDLMIPVVHGTNGEDGVLQGFFELLNVPYTGSGVLSSALAQSKCASKKWMQMHNIPVLEYECIHSVSKTPVFFPCIIKPDRLGSSIGIQVVEKAEAYKGAIQRALMYDATCIVEPFVKDFREFNCSVKKIKGEIVCSDIEEVYKQEAILSFQDKYTSEKRCKRKDIAIELEDTMQKALYAIAKKVYEIFAFDGVIRIDFMLIENTLYVNEINPIPGSYAFYLWEEDLKTLLEECIKEALYKYRMNTNRITSFESDVLFQYKGGKGK